MSKAWPQVNEGRNDILVNASYWLITKVGLGRDQSLFTKWWVAFELYLMRLIKIGEKCTSVKETLEAKEQPWEVQNIVREQQRIWLKESRGKWDGRAVLACGECSSPRLWRARCSVEWEVPSSASHSPTWFYRGFFFPLLDHCSCWSSNEKDLLTILHSVTQTQSLLQRPVQALFHPVFLSEDQIHFELSHPDLHLARHCPFL